MKERIDLQINLDNTKQDLVLVSKYLGSNKIFNQNYGKHKTLLLQTGGIAIRRIAGRETLTSQYNWSPQQDNAAMYA